MAILIQGICLMLLLGMVYSWSYPMLLEQRLPTAYVQTSIEEGSSPSSSLFEDLNRIMSGMHDRFEHMLHWPMFPVHINDDYDLMDNEDKFDQVDNLLNAETKLHTDDDLEIIRKKLDTVEPVCTTVKDSPTTVSPRKSRRKNRPTKQTTTCVKELINHGQKYFLEEIKTTNEKGVLIKQSRSYGTVAVETDLNKQ